jgi:hypothetical protein
MRNSYWNEAWQGKIKQSEEIQIHQCPFSTTNPIWHGLEPSTGRRGGKTASNLLSYNTRTC